LLVVVEVVGGASRADALGQVVVRATAWTVLIGALLFCARPDLRSGRAVVLLLGAAIVLPLLQLIPLPPVIWTALPGRELITHAATMAGEPHPWRPLTIVPGATVNAASSLVVPAGVLWLALSLEVEERRRLPGLLLCLVLFSALSGLTQVSSFSFDNPLINESPRTVSGTFANRNHFALLMALGCPLASVWSFGTRGARPWRYVVGLASMLLFLLAILVSGSRAGLLLGSLGLGLALLLSGGTIKNRLSRSPRWLFPTLVIGVVAVVLGLVLLSVAADRAVSINRVFASDPGQDMRSRGLSTVLSMLTDYFPFGSGLGSFDPTFRIHEPVELLKLTYFNHAHNDFLEVVIDTGLPGLLLLLAALFWWGWASVRAWRAGSDRDTILARLGSAMLLLVMLASVFDYPARTPAIMALVIVAAVWLSGGTGVRRASALPAAG
jgi:O-antigen ligase